MGCRCGRKRRRLGGVLEGGWVKTGWGVRAWSLARTAKSRLRAPWSCLVWSESMYLFFLLGRERGVSVCVRRLAGWSGGTVNLAGNACIRVWIWLCICIGRSHISSSIPVIIPNCVWWGLPQSQWDWRQSGLLPKSAKSDFASSD